jgi:hypothetical protein
MAGAARAHEDVTFVADQLRHGGGELTYGTQQLGGVRRVILPFTTPPVQVLSSRTEALQRPRGSVYW